MPSSSMSIRCCRLTCQLGLASRFRYKIPRMSNDKVAGTCWTQVSGPDPGRPFTCLMRYQHSQPTSWGPVLHFLPSLSMLLGTAQQAPSLVDLCCAHVALPCTKHLLPHTPAPRLAAFEQHSTLMHPSTHAPLCSTCSPPAAASQKKSLSQALIELHAGLYCSGQVKSDQCSNV